VVEEVAPRGKRVRRDFEQAQVVAVEEEKDDIIGTKTLSLLDAPDPRTRNKTIGKLIKLAKS